MSRLNLADVPGDDLLLVLQSLPSREDYDRLYQAFKYRVHPLVPICHLPSLEQDILNFWNRGTMTASGDTLAIILSVTYCGLISINAEQHAHQARSIFDSYERLLRILSFPHDISKATVPLLQSYLLVNSCRASQIEPVSSFGFLSPAVRVAQALNLNLERQSLSSVVKEVQRRIWWHLIYMDVEAAIHSGLPNLIHDEDYTTLMPSQLDDFSITDAQSLAFEAVPVTSPMMLAVLGRWHWALQMRAWRKRRPINEEFEEFERKTRVLLSQIAPGGDNEWSRAYLQLHLPRTICSAARGFLKEDSVATIKCDHMVLR